jgi:hypothetical protein
MQKKYSSCGGDRRGKPIQVLSRPQSGRKQVVASTAKEYYIFTSKFELSVSPSSDSVLDFYINTKKKKV